MSQRVDDSVSAATPLIALAATLFAIAAISTRRTDENFLSDRRWLYLAGGAIVAFIGVFATDSDFPAKRIHIPQYLILALIVRRALSFDLSGRALLVATILLTSILGIHDELMQSLHPARTFGLRDIGVNALGACSGAILAAGFSPSRNTLTTMRIFQTPWIQTGVLLLGLGLMLAPLESLRDAPVPIWTILPLVAALPVMGLLYWRDPAQKHRPTRVISGAILATPLYLLLSYAPIFNFH
ncbi:MAG: VanZ family protein [Alphaproteobacteria bacterium]|nr:VanZ family protein [Alphaproteobacteria bacterium]